MEQLVHYFILKMLKNGLGGFKMFETIELFGKKVNIKNTNCTLKGKNPNKTQMSLNLYIKVTDMCNAKCSVCSNHGNEKISKIDLEKLKYVIKYLDNKNLINRIGVTGGEPFLDIDNLNNILNTIFEVKPNAFVTINTNGFRIKECLSLDNIFKIDGIHISRHHYLDEVNNNFFGLKVASINDINNVIENTNNKKLIRLNCLLMKSYINNIKEVERYLEMASELNIFRCGFVSLMPINDMSKKEFINFNDVFNNIPSNFLKTREMNDLNICECGNGIYLADNGNIVEYYARMTKELNLPYARQFVYTSDNHLTVGFKEKSLI